MLMSHQNRDIHLCTTPTDMRKSIDGLCALIFDADQVPTNNHIYVFCNRVSDKLKLLYWDGNGFCLLYKRLEKGRFKIPQQAKNVLISHEELRWLLQGIDFQKLPKAPVFKLKYIS